MHIQSFSFPSVLAKSEGCLGKILGCEIAGGPLNNPHKTAEQAGHILICKKKDREANIELDCHHISASPKLFSI